MSDLASTCHNTHTKETNFIEQANFSLPITYNTFAVQRAVITFLQTQKKENTF